MYPLAELWGTDPPREENSAQPAAGREANTTFRPRIALHSGSVRLNNFSSLSLLIQNCQQDSERRLLA